MRRDPNQLDLFARPEGGILPALTIWAPWSELIVRGAKRCETRSWPAPHRVIGERMGIHAAGRMPVATDVSPLERVAIEGALELPQARWRQLPRSALVATVRVQGVYQILEVRDGWAIIGQTREGSAPAKRLWIRDETTFGDFTGGRWIWHFADLTTFRAIPMPGTQGIWLARL